MQAATEGTILVIDDEDGMRSLLQALMESVGIETLLAETTKEAIELLRAHRSEIVGCLLDMNLEDGFGEHLYDQLVEISPNLRIFPMSGIFGDEILKRLGDRKIAGLIAKPFSAAQLLDTVRKGLADT